MCTVCLPCIDNDNLVVKNISSVWNGKNWTINIFNLRTFFCSIYNYLGICILGYMMSGFYRNEFVFAWKKIGEHEIFPYFNKHKILTQVSMMNQRLSQYWKVITLSLMNLDLVCLQTDYYGKCKDKNVDQFWTVLIYICPRQKCLLFIQTK